MESRGTGDHTVGGRASNLDRPPADAPTSHAAADDAGDDTHDGSSSRTGTEDLRLILAGAALGNGNRGVEALSRSVADAVHREAPGAHLSILDDGWGVRPEASGRYPAISVDLVGVRQSRRWHRPESWTQIRLAQATVPRLNAVARRFHEVGAVLDLSAGDSFTDLYGPVRLRTVVAPKEAALRAGRPLVLLPQTYGPFTTPEARRLATRIIRSATLAYARDPWSFQQLLELAGPDADPARMRNGVDVAFALEPRQPSADIVEQVETLSSGPTAGVNVSGLLLDQDAHDRFGIVGNYLETMTGLVQALIETGAHVVLVPHVHGGGGAGESDIRAIERVRDSLTGAQRRRTTVLSPDLDAAEVKWCISRLDWFVGSRMHATIAALSTMTPTAAYAYSDKTQGVFETCGVGGEVVDARDCGGQEAVERLMAGYHARAATRSTLAEHATATVTRSREQLRDVFEVARHPAHPTGRGGLLR